MDNKTRAMNQSILKIKTRRDLTDEQIAGKMGITFEKLKAYLDGRDEIPDELLSRIGSLANSKSIRLSSTTTEEPQFPRGLEADEPEDDKTQK